MPDRQQIRLCQKCGLRKPLDYDHFSHTPAGNYRRVCKPCMAAHSSRWSKAHPEKVRQKNRRRAAREALSIGDHTEKDIETMRSLQGGHCYYCGCDLFGDCHKDHKIPIAQGGTNRPSNIVLACPTCNQNKHAKTDRVYIDLRRQRGLPLADWHRRSLIAVSDALQIRVSTLDLSVRTANALKNADIEFMGDLVKSTEQELLRLPHFGRRCLMEIWFVVGQYRLSLGMGPEDLSALEAN